MPDCPKAAVLLGFRIYFPSILDIKQIASTNNLLAHTNLDSFIEINLDIDELDVTAAECKATYQEIRQYIHDKYGAKIPNLYIAQTKRKFGMEVGANYNLSKKDSHSVPQCPPEKELMIIEALKHFRMI